VNSHANGGPEDEMDIDDEDVFNELDRMGNGLG
jgi:hypothetical protein